MSKVWAIMRRELQSYFVSPIAYAVLAIFALISGYFFYSGILWFSNYCSMGMGMYGGGPQVMNINELLLSNYLKNLSVVILFFFPLLTMRLLAEEKKSGTAELLLTAPITDAQIVWGKFLAAGVVYAAMLGVTVIFLLLLVLNGGRPDVMPLLTGYLGLLLYGLVFLSLGLLCSSFTSNQIVAAAISFGLFLLLWVISWVSESVGPTLGAIVKFISFNDHLQDFVGGAINTKDLVYYLSVILLALFGTQLSLHSVHWRR